MSNEPSSSDFIAAPAGEVKPGYTTTEFIGKCAVQLVAILVLTGIIPSADQAHASDLAIALIGAVEAFYAFSRGLAKQRGW